MGNSESLQLNSNPRYSNSQVQQYTTYNGQRVSKRLEDEYVDISSDVIMEAFSKEQMEDQFIKIVVSNSYTGWPGIPASALVHTMVPTCNGFDLK